MCESPFKAAQLVLKTVRETLYKHNSFQRNVGVKQLTSIGYPNDNTFDKQLSQIRLQEKNLGVQAGQKLYSFVHASFTHRPISIQVPVSVI